ncbi:hypothetical protein BJM06_a00074 (plasmid) [Enterobacter cloacae]|nr:hypothetical protein BJM06_a00074 [Enterobacter cloacae]
MTCDTKIVSEPPGEPCATFYSAAAINCISVNATIELSLLTALFESEPFI